MGISLTTQSFNLGELQKMSKGRTRSAIENNLNFQSHISYVHKNMYYIIHNKVISTNNSDINKLILIN